MDTHRPVPPAGRPRPGATAPTALLVLLTVLFVAALLAASVPAGFGAGAVGGSRVWAGRAGHPPLAADVAGAPLGRPAAAPDGAGGYRVLETQDDGSGRPVRWDPCRPIHYVVRPDGEPPGGAVAVASAVRIVAQLTGLRFVDDGGTTEIPRRDRPTMDVRRYGDRWSPVLVAWTDPVEYPALAGYAGLGGPDGAGGVTSGRRRYVTGVVLLNRRHLAEVTTWPQGPAQVQAVVLHEFGHLVGLDHVADPGQLMYRQPTLRSGAGFADGDRRGLAAVSGGPCFRDF